MRELVEFLVRALVEDPDAVQVEEVEDGDATVLEVHVAERRPRPRDRPRGPGRERDPHDRQGRGHRDRRRPRDGRDRRRRLATTAASCGSTSSPCSRSGSSGSPASATCATRSRPARELRLFNYRDTTPLTGGQVDDTPYGGGAGMVLRVDVVDAALHAAYGEPVGAAGDRPRPSGRQLDDALASELAAEPHVALLCGRYEGIDERVAEHLADRRRLDRPLRALRRRARGDGRRRRRDPQAAGRARPRRERGRGVVLRGARRGAGVPALHAPGRPTAAGTCPRCCSRATTSGCARGAWSAAPSAAATPPRKTRRELRYYLTPRAGPVLLRPRFLTPDDPTAASTSADSTMSTIIESIERRQLQARPALRRRATACASTSR